MDRCRETRDREEQELDTVLSADPVRLWTRQDSAVCREMIETGFYRVREEYIRRKNDTISEYYIDLYRWLTKEAKKYVDIPQGAAFPIWLTMSRSSSFEPSPGTVVMTFEIPRECVAVLNVTAWGYRQNYWYVPENRDDEMRFRSELVRCGVKEQDELISSGKGNFYPLLTRQIRASWSRVFTMRPKNFDDANALIWELRAEWLKEIREYE